MAGENSLVLSRYRKRGSNLFVGHTHSTLALPPFPPQCSPYIRSKTTLSAFRNEYRRRTQHTFCAPRQSRLVTPFLFSLTLHFEHTRPSRNRRVESASRCSTRCMGTGSLGSHSAVVEAILPLQSRTRPCILAFPPHPSFGSSAQHHGRHHHLPGSSPFLPTHPALLELFPADQRHSSSLKRSPPRVRY